MGLVHLETEIMVELVHNFKQKAVKTEGIAFGADIVCNLHLKKGFLKNGKLCLLHRVSLLDFQRKQDIVEIRDILLKKIRRDLEDNRFIGCCAFGRMYYGGKHRGCIEAPHLTKHGDYYYIMCAEGGTGYYHSVTMGRSKNVWGPYEPDPCNPILTSNPAIVNERADWDHLKPRYYNSDVKLQKAGHASYVDLPNGETWMVFHTSRPFTPELRCTLGRETSIQRMRWTEDGWLRTVSGSNLVEEFVEPSALPECPARQLPAYDDFDTAKLNMGYYAPRIDPESFVDLVSRPGWAGLILYYDNMNFLYLYKYYSETLDHSAISILELQNGVKREYHDTDSTRTFVEDGKDIYMRVSIRGRDVQFSWSVDGEEYAHIGPVFDISRLSDEYSEYGEFTGTFVGITCGDRMMHKHTADFDFFDYQAEEHANVE